MPELPEVETVRRGLSALIVGKTVHDVWYDNAKSFPNDPRDVTAFLRNASIVSIERRAKVLIIHLSTNYSIVVHLKMTGQLVFRGDESFGAGHPSDSLIGRLPDKTTRVILTFTDASELFFNDQRKFGWMRLLPTVEVPNIDFMRTVGPEPLTKTFTLKVFINRVKQRPKTAIKAALLDQKIIAGIGNIYADESLFMARIHPASIVRALPTAALRRLYLAIPSVLHIALEKGGSTDKNYVDAEGKKGSYIAFANVFRKEGQPCPRCGNTICKVRVASRGTHVCMHCQKLYVPKELT